MPNPSINKTAVQVVNAVEKLYNPSEDSNKYKWTVEVLQESLRIAKELKDQFQIRSEGGAR